MMTVSEIFLCIVLENIFGPIGATMSLSQLQYSVVESNASLSVMIMLSSRASKDVMVEVSLSDGSANGNVEQ